jgi:hypothetical protein
LHILLRLQNTFLEPANSTLSRLGILIEPSQVRLRTTPDDLDIWEILKEKEYLFKKNISDHSIAVLKELYEGVGTSSLLLRGSQPKVTPAGCFQEKVYATQHPT